MTPPPPQGLSERIKSDIPKYLVATTERERATRSISFGMRAAAAIFFLISSTLLTVYLLTPGEQEGEYEIAVREPQQKNVEPLAVTTPAPEPAAEADAETTDGAVQQIARAEVADASRPGTGTPAAAETASLPPGPDASEPLASDDRSAKTAGATFDAAEAEQLADARSSGSESEIEPRAAALASPIPAPAAPQRASRETAAPAAAAARTESAARMDAFHVAADASPTLFGISIDTDEFDRLRSLVEEGSQPAAGAVDVEAVVNYFAGAPQRRPRSGVRLEVEASPAPVELEGDRAVLRLTIDTPAADDAITAAARNARVSVDINEAAVARVRRIGSGGRLTPEETLPYNASVTAVWDLQLKPRLRANDVIATVRLAYREPDDGQERVIERKVRARELTGGWTRASRRHRLASLGAIWGETLQGRATGADVAERAAELATQNPGDQRARELAAVARATYRVRVPSP